MCCELRLLQWSVSARTAGQAIQAILLQKGESKKPSGLGKDEERPWHMGKMRKDLVDADARMAVSGWADRVDVGKAGNTLPALLSKVVLQNSSAEPLQL